MYFWWHNRGSQIKESAKLDDFVYLQYDRKIVDSYLT